MIARPITELGRIFGASLAPMVRLMDRVAAAEARRLVSGGEFHDDEARLELGTRIGELMAVSDMLGRRRLLMELDAAIRKASRPAKFADSYNPARSLPSVPFERAVEDLVSREPRLARSAAEVAQVYVENHGFALAFSTSTTITERVQEAMHELMERGQSLATAEAIIAEIGGFTRAYAETVYRTNMATAYTAGRYREATDPDIAPIVGGFELTAVGDVDTRPTHRAASGLVAPADDPIWEKCSVPLGYNCRCAQRVVTIYEARRRGWATMDGPMRRILPPGFSGFIPDARFVGKPSRRFYGS